MKKSSAEFLKFRESEINLSELEERHQTLIPPIYRSFLEVFDSIKSDVIKLKSGSIDYLNYYQYFDGDGYDLLLEGIMDIESSLKYKDNAESWIENRLMPITSHSHGGTILLGYHDSNSDKLFFEYDEGPQLIENNIYTFLRKLRFKFNESYSKETLYKKWGENFWMQKDDIGLA